MEPECQEVFGGAQHCGQQGAGQGDSLPGCQGGPGPSLEQDVQLEGGSLEGKKIMEGLEV